MIEAKLIYPALHGAAGTLSANAQRDYLWSLRAEYALLITCGAMSGRSATEGWYYYLFTLLFCLALGLFIWRFVTKPEQTWYQARALAESVKTSAWRFCMRAAPFDDDNDLEATRNFQDHLKSILKANEFAGSKLPADFAAEDQVTSSMCKARELSLADRRSMYEDDRIRDQRRWYARKAGSNKKIVKRWVLLCVLIYVSAIISGLYRATHPTVGFSPTDMFIAIAAFIVGWIQIKKFNELAASYILTAHEIGILHSTFTYMLEEQPFREFVNDAEQAFSREHTQWVARTER